MWQYVAKTADVLIYMILMARTEERRWLCYGLSARRKGYFPIHSWGFCALRARNRHANIYELRGRSGKSLDQSNWIPLEHVTGLSIPFDSILCIWSREVENQRYIIYIFNLELIRPSKVALRENLPVRCCSRGDYGSRNGYRVSCIMMLVLASAEKIDLVMRARERLRARTFFS